MTIGIVGSNKKGAAYSIDAVQKGILNTNLGRLINKLEGRDKKLASMKLLDEFKSGRFDSDIIREGYELRKMQDSETDAKNAIRPSGAGAKIGITGNKKAMAIAKILHETFMDMDYTSNRAGANIAKSEIGSFARPSYNRTKILTAIFLALFSICANISLGLVPNLFIRPVFLSTFHVVHNILN